MMGKQSMQEITMKKIAAGALQTSASAIFALMAGLVVSGCSSLPAPPSRAAQYDFGPGPTSLTPTDRRAPLSPLTVQDVDSPGIPEGSTAVYYRLAYSEAQQLQPYSQARWSQPPAQLLQQRMRDQLGQRRPVLNANDGAAQARVSGKQPQILRVELEEFSHLFRSSTDSVGLLRLRATLVEPAEDGERLLGQRLFIVQKPAATADAAGGTRALAEAAGQAAQELATWTEALAR